MSPSNFPATHPSFFSLPLDPAGPPGNAWGLFGCNSQLRRLNLLTPDVVAAAAKEITTGIRFSLDWPLNKPSYPSFGRKPFEHKLINREGRTVNDDALNFNTQCSSQWDGFRHYGYQKARRYYNGHTQEELQNTGVIGIHSWVENSGIAGRGVLLDYADWAFSNGIKLEAMSSTAISLVHLKQLIKEKDIKFRPGDILLIRSGFTEAYETLSIAEQKAPSERASAEFIGVEASKIFWNSYGKTNLRRWLVIRQVLRCLLLRVHMLI